MAKRQAIRRRKCVPIPRPNSTAVADTRRLLARLHRRRLLRRGEARCDTESRVLVIDQTGYASHEDWEVMLAATQGSTVTQATPLSDKIAFLHEQLQKHCDAAVMDLSGNRWRVACRRFVEVGKHSRWLVPSMSLDRTLNFLLNHRWLYKRAILELDWTATGFRLIVEWEKP